MLKKLPKSWVRFGLKIGAIGAALELAALGGTYLFWRKLNSDQEFRYRVGANYPAVLEGYYKIGDYWDPENSKELRNFDQEFFTKTNKEIKKD